MIIPVGLYLHVIRPQITWSVKCEKCSCKGPDGPTAEVSPSDHMVSDVALPTQEKILSRSQTHGDIITRGPGAKRMQLLVRIQLLKLIHREKAAKPNRAPTALEIP